MKLLADVHISPRTVTFLRGLGHDVVRVGPDYLRSTVSDADIVAAAIVDERIDVLERALPMIETDLAAGALVTVEEQQVRVRRLPIA